VSAARIAALAIAIAIASTRGVSAQTSAAGRVEASIGAIWIGHQALGEIAANETTSTGAPFRIFTASSDLAAAAGFDGRIAVRVLRSLEAALDASYTKPQLKTTLANDIENAPPVTAIETMQQAMVGGSVNWYPPIGATSRLAPFVTAGGGYLRQVHEAGTLLQTGHYYQFGGGVKYLLFSHPGAHVKGLGLRVDARAVLRAKGIAFDDKMHAAPAIGAAAFVRF
jgi:hypothetical protein